MPKSYIPYSQEQDFVLLPSILDWVRGDSLAAFVSGVVRSRRLAQALEEQVPYRYLGGNQQPDFRTISDFRKEYREALQGLFVEVLRLCKPAGLVRLGRIALDVCKVAGNERSGGSAVTGTTDSSPAFPYRNTASAGSV